MGTFVELQRALLLGKMVSVCLEKILFQTRTKKRKTCSGMELPVMLYFAKHKAYSSGKLQIFFKQEKHKILTKTTKLQIC
jgi:hypothetical protein